MGRAYHTVTLTFAESAKKRPNPEKQKKREAWRNPEENTIQHNQEPTSEEAKLLQFFSLHRPPPPLSEQLWGPLSLLNIARTSPGWLQYCTEDWIAAGSRKALSPLETGEGGATPQEVQGRKAFIF